MKKFKSWLISLAIITVFCNSKTLHTIGITKKMHYDCLISDSIRIDGKMKVSAKYTRLVSLFGKPDSIIRYTEEDDFYDNPYSIVEYESMQFRLFDDESTFISRLTFENSNHFISYGKLKLNENTLIDDLKTLFPNSYYLKDTTSSENRPLVAMRFFTDSSPTDTQWVLLFEQNRLKFIHYFDGNS